MDNKDTLKKTLGMHGIYPEFRAACWQLLLGYLPPQVGIRQEKVDVDRKTYYLKIAKLYRLPENQLPEKDTELVLQIKVDVPRTSCSGFPFIASNNKIQKASTQPTKSNLFFKLLGLFRPSLECSSFGARRTRRWATSKD